MDFVLQLREGHKVFVKYPDNGCVLDRKMAAHFLKEDATYTVSKVNVDRFDTFIQLQEVPGGVWFNAVLFDYSPLRDATPQKPSSDVG